MKCRKFRYVAILSMSFLLIGGFFFGSIAQDISYICNWPSGESYKPLCSPAEYSYGLTYAMGSLWLADRDTSTVYRIDPTDGSVIQEFRVAAIRPTDITFDGSHLWIASELRNSLFRIDPVTGEVSKSIPSPAPRPAGLAWDGQYLWCASRKSNSLYKINPTSGEILSQIEDIWTPDDVGWALPRSPRGLMWWEGSLYHIDSVRGRIYQLDPNTGHAISEIIRPTIYPRSITTDGSKVWYTDSKLGIFELSIQVSENCKYILSNPEDWSIRYALKRTNIGEAVGKDYGIRLGVPRSFPHQHVMSVQYNPEPARYVVDRYGQQIAIFEFGDVEPGESVTIEARYEVRLWHINYIIDLDQVGGLDDLPADVKALYTCDGEKYQIDNPVIIEAAGEAVGDETNPYLMAVRIHDYVADKLDYGDGPTGWGDAPSVLQKGEGQCSEHTFCVIALARAVGLPACFNGSTVLRREGADTIGHRWAEIFIPNYGWIPFDATKDGGEGKLGHLYVGTQPAAFVLVTGGGMDKYLHHTYLDCGTWCGSEVRIDRDWKFSWEELENCTGEATVVRRLEDREYTVLYGSASNWNDTLLQIKTIKEPIDARCVGIAVLIDKNGREELIRDTLHLASGVGSKLVTLGAITDAIRVKDVSISYPESE